MVQIFLKLSLKQRILAVHYDFHWLLVATKFLTMFIYVMRRSRSWESVSKIFERWKSESDISSPTLQLCYRPLDAFSILATLFYCLWARLTIGIDHDYTINRLWKAWAQTWLLPL